MSPRTPVVLLEFNELTPALMDRFIADGKLPNFARLRASSEIFISDAEEQEPYLEPWNPVGDGSHRRPLFRAWNLPSFQRA